MHLGEIEQAEEVFRIGIQYAQEGVAAADLFRRLGEALLQNDRPGEAIGPLRRALAFGGPPAEVMPPLARAFLRRRKWVAAYACLRDALDAGVSERELADELRAGRGGARRGPHGLEGPDSSDGRGVTRRARGGRLRHAAGCHAACQRR